MPADGDGPVDRIPPVVRNVPQMPLVQTGVLPPQAAMLCQLPALVHVCGVFPLHCPAPGLHATHVPAKHTGVLPEHTGEHAPASETASCGASAAASPPDELEPLPPLSLAPLLLPPELVEPAASAPPELLLVVEPELEPPEDAPASATYG